MHEKGEDSFSIVFIEDTTGNFLMMCFLKRKIWFFVGEKTEGGITKNSVVYWQ